MQRPAEAIVEAAWGDRFLVDPRKFIGAHLYMRGVHELPICETIYRLAGRGETILDVGANIGVMTSIASRRAGPDGRVISIEAHPVIVEQLKSNSLRWTRGNIEIIHAAASDHSGELLIVESPGFGQNEGTAKVERTNEKKDSVSYRVQSICLDDVIGGRSIGVVKIDVEGHEGLVIEGARRSLDQHLVRDIIFESSSDYPNPVHRKLTGKGYSIVEIGMTLLGPILSNPSTGDSEVLRDYLATLDLPRAQRLLESTGWEVLKRQVKDTPSA